MTQFEYTNLKEKLSEYIGTGKLTIHSDPIVTLTYMGSDDYVEGTYPKANFEKKYGKEFKMDMATALSLLSEK